MRYIIGHWYYKIQKCRRRSQLCDWVWILEIIVIKFLSKRYISIFAAGRNSCTIRTPYRKQLNDIMWQDVGNYGHLLFISLRNQRNVISKYGAIGTLLEKKLPMSLTSDLCLLDKKFIFGHNNNRTLYFMHFHSHWSSPLKVYSQITVGNKLGHN